MNYVDAGYVIGLGTLAAYGLSIVARERAARRRLRARPVAGGAGDRPAAGEPGAAR